MATEKDKISEELQIYIRKGAWDKAVMTLDRLARLEPRNPVHRLRKGDYYLKAGNKPQAIEAYHGAAAGFAEEGFIVKALAAYKVILRLDPNDERAHERMLNLHEKACEVTGQRRVAMTPGAPIQEAPAPAVMESRTEPFPAGAEPGSLEEGVVGVQPPDYQSMIESTRHAGSSGKGMETAAAPTGFQVERTSYEDSIPGPRAWWRPTHALPLFSCLSREEFGEIAERMIELQCPVNDTIVKEGDTGDSVFLISRGAVKVVTRVGDREIILTNLKSNDFFGEVAFLTGKPRTADVITTEETEILELPGKELRAIVEKHPALREVLEAFYKRRVTDTIEKIKNERAVL